MRRLRLMGWKWIAVSTLGILVLAGLIFVFVNTRPVDLTAPEHPVYPPTNAYSELVSAAKALDEKTTALKIPRGWRSAKDEPFSEAARKLLAETRVTRSRVRAIAARPWMPLHKYDLEELFPKFTWFRTFHRLEAVEMRRAARAGDWKLVIDRYRTGLDFSTKLVSSGLLMAALVSVADDTIQNAVIVNNIERLPAGVCDELIRIIRDRDRRDVSAETLWTAQKYATIRL